MAAPKIAPSGVVRKSNFGLMAISFATTIAVGFMSFILPPVAAGINFCIDRVTNGIKAKRELKARMNWYRPQIARTLGMDEDKVTVKDFKKAAEINPMLAAAVKDVKRTEDKDNKTSAVVNAATTFIPGVDMAVGATRTAKLLAGAAEVGKQLAAATAGGMLVEWASKEHINAQEALEGIAGQLNAAREQGVDPRTVVTPQMVFLLRVSQDEVLEAQIKQRYKKPFQKMSETEMQAVMLEYKPLADAVTSEAYAVAQGILPPQELMARAPNLKSNADKYRVGSGNSSFVDNLRQQRAAAAAQGQAAAV